MGVLGDYAQGFGGRYTRATVNDTPSLVHRTGWNDLQPEYVELLLHFDAAAGSATFVDASPVARVPSTVTGAEITANAVAFGSGGARTNAAWGNVAYAASADFQSAGDWTLSFWLFWPSAGVADGLYRFMAVDAVSYFSIAKSGASVTLTPNGWLPGLVAQPVWSLTPGAWHYVALSHAADGTGRLFFNGTKYATDANGAGTTTARALGLFAIPGRTDLASLPNAAVLDEVLFIRQVLHSANFNPPTSPWGLITQ